MPTCRKCGVELTVKNHYLSDRSHKCKACQIERVKAWQKAHLHGAHSSREYMRTYMRGYRKKNQKRVREIARLTFHRRDRELSTETVLNEHFEGANLHHMTPSVAIYVPEELHKSVFHNLKTGLGMKEINARVVEWFEKAY